MNRYQSDAYQAFLCLAPRRIPNWEPLARNHPHIGISGEGDNRILMKGREEIKVMVQSMVETAKMADSYFMRVGNCIPHNVPSENVKLYFDLCAELGYR